MLPFRNPSLSVSSCHNHSLLLLNTRFSYSIFPAWPLWPRPQTAENRGLSFQRTLGKVKLRWPRWDIINSLIVRRSHQLACWMSGHMSSPLLFSLLGSVYRPCSKKHRPGCDPKSIRLSTAGLKVLTFLFWQCYKIIFHLLIETKFDKLTRNQVFCQNVFASGYCVLLLRQKYFGFFPSFYFAQNIMANALKHEWMMCG